MKENIRLAFQGIWGHKLRSFLTMLGIIIGIASIITIVSTIKGTNEQIKQNLIGAGNNVVAVQLYEDEYVYDLSYNTPPAGVRPMDQEVRDELEKLSGVEEASFYYSRDNVDGSVYWGRTSFSGSLYGVDDQFFSVNGYQLTAGRDFLERDFSQLKRVAIIDSTAASNVFQGSDPVGQIIEIRSQPYTVVGVVEKTSSFTPKITSLDDYYMYADTSSGRIFVPQSTWPIIYRFDEPQSVAVRAGSTDSMTRAGKNVADYLTEHQIAASVRNVSDSTVREDGSEDSASANDTAASGGRFSYRSQDLLKQAEQLQKMSESTNTQLIWIASISLLVGGIGVMNIMLVSVTERTSEIGLKKAIGAKKRRILRQFLTEAAVLTSLGGILGVLLGIGFAQIISGVMDIPVAVSVPAIVVAVLFSTVIGVVFGLVPAVKAANLNPIDALRRE